MYVGSTEWRNTSRYYRKKWREILEEIILHQMFSGFNTASCYLEGNGILSSTLMDREFDGVNPLMVHYLVL